jgi:MFS family permease
VYGFVCAAGGSVGLLLGGVLTSALNWHWIFLVNLPIGAAVYALCMGLLPHAKVEGTHQKLDVTGAIMATGSMMLAVYAVVNGNEAGWTSVQTLGLLGAAVVVLIAFIVMESRLSMPLMPLTLFKLRNFNAANLIGVLWAAGMFAWFFITTLYLQAVLGFSPFQIGLVFLPANLIMAAFSLGLSARIVMRFGVRKPLAIGLFFGAAGLAIMARAPMDANVMVDVIPSMVLLGIAAGISFNPLLLAAMNDVKPTDSGLASGVVNTAFMMGGSLGLAVIASVAAGRTQALAASGMPGLEALNSGYHVAFVVGAVFAAVSAIIGATLIRVNMSAPQAGAPEMAMH